MKNSNGKGKIGIILVILIVILIAGAVGWYFAIGKDMLNEKGSTSSSKANEKDVEKIQGKEQEVSSEFEIKDCSLGAFDLEFLKLENNEENMIYSPLSIKYTLGMLNEATSGNSKLQIERVIGNYLPNKFYNSENMSFANAFFIRDQYQDQVKSKLINNLENKFGAEVIFDSFGNARKVNSWISDKTLGLINNALEDSDIDNLNFALVNALAIDMEWEERFLANIDAYADYTHEKFSWYSPDNLVKGNFQDVTDKISGMQIMSSINRYDLVNEIGEEEIRKTVGDAFRKHLEEHPDSYYFEENLDIDTIVNSYLDTYIEDINRNYKDVSTTTDYSFYVDDDVKVFGKDLKKYDGTTLEYVAIMPTTEDLESYIENSSAESINNTVSNLKELKVENATDGVITVINGYIPKFKFDYKLDLINDLEEMGIKDVFDSKKADLSELTSEKAYIGSAIHKANIEFTQDGIKAAATTEFGGLGAGGEFDYYYDVKVEEIDLTFDKPYMFIIRDKDTGEVWFSGTVYNPLLAKDDERKDEILDDMSKVYINNIDTVYSY